MVRKGGEEKGSGPTPLPQTSCMILVESLNFGRRWDGRALAEVQRSKFPVKVGCTGLVDHEARVPWLSHASSHLLPLKCLCGAVTLLSGKKYRSLSSQSCCVPTAITAVKYPYNRGAPEFAANFAVIVGKDTVVYEYRDEK